jgi:hypothetical protein
MGTGYSLKTIIFLWKQNQKLFLIIFLIEGTWDTKDHVTLACYFTSHNFD